MDRLCQAIQDLIRHLKSTPVAQQSLEAECLRHLDGLLKAAENRNLPLLNRKAGEIRNFWLQSVPWCSTLSRDVEKLLILYEEMLQS